VSAPRQSPRANPAVRASLAVLGRLLRGRRADPANSVQRMPELAAPDSIALTSESFAHGAPIPDRNAPRGADRSPQLAWSGLPDGTAQLLLVMEDPDVPFAHPALHMIALLPPEPAALAEGALAAGAAPAGARFVPGFARRTGYHGPGALPGHGVHRYDFLLFALDRAIPASTPLPGFAALRPLVAGHVLARGHLQGTQEG
jgi:phosphatidylethanolamine-binding protein (PEBP) family uncharacterized protein